MTETARLLRNVRKVFRGRHSHSSDNKELELQRKYCFTGFVFFVLFVMNLTIKKQIHFALILIKNVAHTYFKFQTKVNSTQFEHFTESIATLRTNSSKTSFFTEILC